MATVSKTLRIGSMDRKNKPRRTGRALKMSGVQTFQLRVLLLVMVGETPSCTATNSREFALNSLSHIVGLVKSDGFLIAVCGVWLCSMIAWCLL